MTRAGYAPYPLDDLPARLGLETVTLPSTMGATVAHHRGERTSECATVFLHGAAGSWTTWTALLAAAEDAGVTVENPVLIDVPGFGASEFGAVRSVDDITTRVVGAVRALGYERWHLVGHSMGGLIALDTAARHPEDTLSVGLVSATMWSVIESVEAPVRRFGTLPAFTMLLWLMRVLARLGRAGTAIARGAHRLGLLRTLVTPLFRHGYRVDDSLVDSVAADIRPWSFATASDLVRGYDARGRWSGIRCPVHAIAGDRDVFVRDSDLERLVESVPGARVTTIDDCGHFAHVERPTEALRALGLPRCRMDS